MTSKSISILGCGWLGFPLAQRLLAHEFLVKGSTRTESKLRKLTEAGIKGYRIALEPELKGANVNDFFNTEILVVNFPPERRSNLLDYHTRQIQHLISFLQQSTVKKVLFVSSTSVYPNVNREVTEEDVLTPKKESGAALLKAEAMLQQEKKFTSTVLRFAGLYGPDRKPGRFLAGKENMDNGMAPVNLIHLEDCVNIIVEIIRQEKWGEVYNACSDQHPTRAEFYPVAARKMGLPAPTFRSEETSSFKVISNRKVKADLNYQFIYPDPLAAIEKL